MKIILNTDFVLLMMKEIKIIQEFDKNNELIFSKEEIGRYKITAQDANTKEIYEEVFVEL